MNGNIRKFLEKVAQDPEIAAKLSAIKDPDEAYALASSVQDGFTKEEFVSAMEQLKASAENGEELSDEDIGKMAGGGVYEVAASAAGSVVAVSTISIGAAAAAI